MKRLLFCSISVSVSASRSAKVGAKTCTTQRGCAQIARDNCLVNRKYDLGVALHFWKNHRLTLMESIT